MSVKVHFLAAYGELPVAESSLHVAPIGDVLIGRPAPGYCGKNEGF
jgi:hypothetical protein